MLGFEIASIDTHCVGLAAADEHLQALEVALRDMHEPLEGIVDDLHHQASAQFATLGMAADTPWDPLDPTTVRDKIRMGYPAPGWPLVATGELRDAAVNGAPYGYGETGMFEATFGLDMERNGWNIAALQQFGVEPRIVNRRAYTTHTGKHVRATSYLWHLPSRPMLVASEGLLHDGADRIAAHIWNPLAG